jgi:hypothetical protein
MNFCRTHHVTRHDGYSLPNKFAISFRDGIVLICDDLETYIQLDLLDMIALKYDASIEDPERILIESFSFNKKTKIWTKIDKAS